MRILGSGTPRLKRDLGYYSLYQPCTSSNLLPDIHIPACSCSSGSSEPVVVPSCRLSVFQINNERSFERKDEGVRAASVSREYVNTGEVTEEVATSRTLSCMRR